VILPQPQFFGSSKPFIMTTKSISFIAVFDKYIVYSEAISQYYALEEEDQKIIEPYIRRLKESWQDELKQVKSKLQGFRLQPF